MKWFKVPYKSVRMLGELWTDKLLPPDIKQMFDLLIKFKGSYIGIADGNATLFVDNQPMFKIKNTSIDDIKELCDDVKEYSDLNEYRLSEDRRKQILSYYQTF